VTSAFAGDSHDKRQGRQRLEQHDDDHGSDSKDDHATPTYGSDHSGQSSDDQRFSHGSDSSGGGSSDSHGSGAPGNPGSGGARTGHRPPARPS
jgi:hypothetical protein